MKRLNFFESLGGKGTNDSLAELDNQLKNFLSEIITLRHIRKEQMKTISELRSENHRLKKELNRLKGED